MFDRFTSLTNAEVSRLIATTQTNLQHLAQERHRLQMLLRQIERLLGIDQEILDRAQRVQSWRERAGLTSGDIFAAFAALQPWLRGALITKITMTEPPAEDVTEPVTITVVLRRLDGRTITIVFDQVIAISATWMDGYPNRREAFGDGALALVTAHPTPLETIVEDEGYLFLSGPGDPIGALTLRINGELLIIQHAPAGC